MSSVPRCPRCGNISPSADAAAICSSCAADASAPWWVAPPPLTAPAAPIRRSSRLRWGIVGIAAALLAGGLLAAVFWPRTPPPDNALAAVLPSEEPSADAAAPEDAPAEAPPSPATRPRDKSPAAPPSQPDDRAAIDIASTAPPPLEAPPEVSKPKMPAAAVSAHPLHRLDTATEEDLRRQAATAPIVGLGSAGPAIVDAYLNHVPANQVLMGTAHLTDFTPLLEVRPALRLLPVRFGDSCKLNGKLTVWLDELSRKLRAYLDRFTPETDTGRGGSTEKLRQTLLDEMRGKKPEWLRPEAVKPLVQILMGEETPFRKILVEPLAKIDGPAATVALAQRAVFDLNPEIRESAVAALKDRPAADYRPVLLKALRYPWTVPAQHAAETLVVLKDAAAVPVLVSLLKLPDPAGPLTIHKNRHILQDVVRLNHLNNCLMCHPPAAKADEPVLGVDPVVPLPIRLQSPAMTNATQVATTTHSHGARTTVTVRGPSAAPGVLAQLPLLIRGDITFLRQDFTVRQLAGTPARRRQRFDYVVRTRILSRKANEMLEKVVADRPSYPQRDAVLFALRELTGKDAGPTTEAWLQLFPRAESDVEAARLSHGLARADGLDFERLLAKYRDGEGDVYTKALSCAIASLRGAFKEHVRGALVERLARLPAEKLRERLLDEDAETRRAALLACSRKEEKQLVPDLIALLDNPEPVTARLAEEGLASLTGEHFLHASEWKSWWQRRTLAPE